MIFKNIDLDENIVLKNKIPLLIENEDWIRLFGNIKNRNIQHIKEELTELVKKEKELEKNGCSSSERKTTFYENDFGHLPCSK